MKKRFFVILYIFSISFIFGERSITDMAGRKVTIPETDKIIRIFSGNPIASIILFTLDPDRLAGWNFKIPEKELRILPDKAKEIPVYGTLYGNGKPANVEEVLKSKSQLILLSAPITPALISTAEDLENRYKIPVVILDNSMEKIPIAYTFLGTICGKEKRAKVLGDYSREIIKNAKQHTQNLTKKVKVYYALSDNGLKTYPENTTNTELLEFCGGDNVIKLPYNRKFGPISISFEELVVLKPEIILVGHMSRLKPTDGSLFSKGKWKALGIKSKVIPSSPFSAMDKPPSVNQLGGIIWLQKVLYPESSKYDLDEKLSEFYNLFYNIRS